MISATNHNRAPAYLLEVTFQTKIGVAGGEELGIDRAVRGVTDGASFADGFMFKHVRTTLRRVALKTAFIGVEQCRAASVNRALVWRMTIRTTHFPLRDGMAVGQVELAAHIEVTLQADILLDPPGGQHRGRAAKIRVRSAARQ